MIPASFQFATATQIRFGVGVVEQLPEVTRPFGTRALFVTGSHPERAARSVERLASVGVHAVSFCVSSEPTIAVAEAGILLAREAGCEVVIGWGGGSVLDTAKAIAALLGNGGRPLDYLEGIGAGRKLERAAFPFIAVPTTSGTGAEVTKNAVLASPEHGVKVSLRSDTMLPKVALVDPRLTLSVPPPVTAATGLDALTQVIEPYVSCQANPMTDALCLAGIRHAGRFLRLAYRDGANLEARSYMSLTSLFGGLALANAKLGAVHGIAGPFGGRFHAPHGAVCARLLPSVLRVNEQALRKREPEHPVLRRFDELGVLLTRDETAGFEQAVAWLDQLVSELSVPRLSSYGLSSVEIPALIQVSQRASSMKGNPIVLTQDELRQVIEMAC